MYITERQKVEREMGRGGYSHMIQRKKVARKKGGGRNFSMTKKQKLESVGI